MTVYVGYAKENWHGEFQCLEQLPQTTLDRMKSEELCRQAQDHTTVSVYKKIGIGDRVPGHIREAIEAEDSPRLKANFTGIIILTTMKSFFSRTAKQLGEMVTVKVPARTVKGARYRSHTIRFVYEDTIVWSRVFRDECHEEKRIDTQALGK